MKVAIPSTGSDLDSPVSSRFSRGRFFLFVDTGTEAVEALPNPAIANLEDAGVQAANFVIENGAEMVITLIIGQYAGQVLQDAGIPVYILELGSARTVLDQWHTGSLRRWGDHSGGDEHGRGVV